ncbi:MAG TPA: acyl-CoA reductase [Bacteroidia bacterium]|jgi:hypothetical protein|nr:acyl-CoA reductase [Bacteroidia bacterium]
MKQIQAIEDFSKLGEDMAGFIENPQSEIYTEWIEALRLAEYQNGWFTRKSILSALKGIASWLNKPELELWLSKYPELKKENAKPITVNVIMAGNIPLVGFHDFLSILITGNSINAKLASADSVLLKFLIKKLIAINPDWEKHINVVEKIPNTANAIIATGSNNTARHFEYYFRNMPHIIRKNRNSIAILDGTETAVEIGKLGEDIFSYYGLGCRNISKLFVPIGYDFVPFFQGIEKFKDVVNHNKYANNYNYNRTIFLMDGVVFTDNGFIMVTKKESISSPIAVLHFEEYSDLSQLSETLVKEKENIQCIAVKESLGKRLRTLDIPIVGLGQTQSPKLWDYADGVDVIKFLMEQSNKN